MLYRLNKLEKLSENKIQLMEYKKSYLSDWKNHKTDFLKSSNAPDFIKKILIYKNAKRPNLFFGEAYLAMAVSNTTSAGWFNSWDWISSDNWLNGIYKSNDPFIHELMDQFYENAISKFIDNKLPKILEIQRRFSLKPEPPDLWLVGNNRKHHFIEVKRGNDKPSDEQLFGLLLINVFLKYNIHLVWLYEEGTKPPSSTRTGQYIDKFNALKSKLFDMIEEK